MKLQVLGQLVLSGADLTRPKPLLLLTYVTLEGSRARRDLAELFWPESQDPMQSLRVALAQLNKEAKGAIQSDDKKVWSELPSDVTDLKEFLDKGRYKEALEAYKGAFLDGFDTPIGEELEEWIYKTRESLARTIQEAYLKIAESEASRGHFVYGAQLAEKAYFLRFAPEPDPDTLQRLYLLLKAGESPHLEDVLKEAQGYGQEYKLSVSEAQQQAKVLQPDFILADNPYRGLFAFQEQDTGFFFGRDKAILEVLQLLNKPPHMVTVVGNSGAGKSSLVLAGVIPRLRQQEQHLIVSLRPGRQPFVAIAQALLEGLNGQTEHLLQESQHLAQSLQNQSLELSSLIELMLNRHPQKQVLLVIDQLEELFTINEMRDLSQQDNQQQARQFLEMVLKALRNQEGRLSLLFTLRADFLGTLLAYRPLRDMLQQSQYFLADMDTSELQQSIVEPAQKQGVSFEAGLVPRMLEDLSGQGNLPLLEFALTQLWEKQEKNVLTHKSYDQIGGVEKALALHADETYANLSPEEQRLTQKVFLQLVYPGINQEDTRRIATRDELEDAWPLVHKLASYPARLLVTGYSQNNQQTAEVIHEALIRSWQTLRQWLQEYRSFRIWQERLRQDVRLWSEQHQSEATLLRGYRLSEATQNLERYSDLLSSTEQLFIRQSLDLNLKENSEKEQQRLNQLQSLQQLAIEESSRRQAEQARVKTRNNALRLVSLLGVLALSFAIFFFTARNEAIRARNQAVLAQNEAETQRSLVSSRLSELLGAVALNTLDTTPQRSLLLALEAYKTALNNQSPTQEAESVLREVFSKTGGMPLTHESVAATGFSPDGKWMVSGDDTSMVTFWETGNPAQAIFTLSTSQSALRATEFSPDGRWLATAGVNDTVRLWDLGSFPEQPPTAAVTLEHDGDVTDVAFEPGGKWLATTSRDGYLRLWNTQTWVYTSHYLQNPGLAVAFSPDGKWVAATGTGPQGGQTFLYDMSDPQTIQPVIYTLKQDAWSLNFSQDGQWLVTGDAEGQLHLLSLRTLDVLNPIVLKSQGSAIADLAFSPDGKWLASSSWDQTIRLWPVTHMFEKPLNTTPILLRGHETRLSSALAFSPDSQWLLSGARDGARLWNLGLPQSDLMVLPPESFGKRSFSLSPDGKTMLSGYLDGSVTLQPLNDLMGTATVLGKHDSWVEAVTFSPDGTWAASSSDASNGGKHSLMIWRLDNPATTMVPELPEQAKTLFDLEFSPDQRFLATAGEDKTVQVWELSNLSQPKYIFRGHLDMVTDIAFSKDGSILASASFDNRVRLWNLREPLSPARILEGHNGKVRVLSFSPDGRWLASGDWNQQILLWSFEDLDQPPLRLHAGSAVWSLAFSPDSQVLTAGAEDGTIRIWPIGQESSVKLSGHQKAVWALGFTPDNRWLISASEDNTQRFWLRDKESVKTLACQKAGRNLSPEEWTDVFRSTPYQKTCETFAEGD